MLDASIFGIIGYLVTPFEENDEDVATGKLRQLVDHLLDNGVHAVATL